MKKSATHQAALRYAERGIPVFPCMELGKEPVFEGSFKHASTDPAVIDKWFEQNPNFNIAASPHAAGCCVVDIDAPGAIADLRERYGELPATFTVQTPKGGFHWWFKGEAKGGTGKIKKNGQLQGLAPKVDTRGIGSYVLLAPSRVHYPVDEKKGILEAFTGQYRVIGKVPMAQFPTVLSDVLVAQEALNKATGIEAPNVDLDLPHNVQRGKEAARRWEKSFLGTIDDDTYKYAAELADMKLSPQAIYDIIKVEWYDRTGTDGNLERLHTVAWSGTVNRQNASGVWAVKDPQVEFSAFIGQQFAESAKLNKFDPLTEAEMEALPDTTWLIPNVLPDKQIVMLYAPSKGWKSFLSVDWSMTIASGIPKWGNIAPGAVVYIAAEGPSSLGKIRRPAWRLLHGVNTPVPFHIVTGMPHVLQPEEIRMMCDAIREKVGPIRLLVVDTLARFMSGMDESGVKDASIAVDTLEELKRELNCTILALHHTGKDATRGERGSSALKAGFDSGFELIADKEHGTAELWCRWHRDAEPPKVPWRFKAEQVLGSMAFRFAELDEMPLKDRLTVGEVGAMLDRMKVAIDNPVSAHVLALELAKVKEGWTETKTIKALKVLSKSGRLGPYEIKPGGPFYFPEMEIPF